jgi:hypothetical protein
MEIALEQRKEECLKMESQLQKGLRGNVESQSQSRDEWQNTAIGERDCQT